ncbi:MAG TPA: hypothetical protein DCM57_06650 [Treponema sp.]|jgi:competence protein ComEC|nr:hypothetical protein [Treponema sp.]
MTKFFDFLRNPFVAAAVLCSVLFYTKLIPLKNDSPYFAAIPIEDVFAISGTVDSNPVKSSSGTCYTVSLRLSSVSTEKKEDCLSSAGGIISVRIPSSLVEAVYPGRLYSLGTGALLVEAGEKIYCTGKWSRKYNAFIAETALYRGHTPGFFGSISHIRAKSRLIFKRLLFSWSSAGGLVLSLLSGSREYLENGVGDSFRNAGLSHILALSGMHLSFFAGLAGGAGKTLGGKKIRTFAQLAGILFFVWFAGLSPSLFRALICSLLAIISRFVFCRKTDTFEILCAAFLLHSVLRPGDLFSAAFLLSYGALAGILLLGDSVSRVLAKSLPPSLSSPLSASFAAQSATCPISISLFGSFTPIGIVSTVFVSPVVSLFLTLSVIFIILSLAIPFLSPAFGVIMNTLYKLIVSLVSVFARVPPVQI